MSRKSAHHFVLVVSFLCVVLFASRNGLLFHDFRSSAPAISPVDLRYSVCDGVPGSAWLVAPPFPNYFFFFFSSFGLKLSHGVYVRCLRGNLFPIISLLGTV